MTNSADPDQKPTDLDLHCLQRQGISRFSRTRVKIISYKELLPNIDNSQHVLGNVAKHEGIEGKGHQPKH